MITFNVYIMITISDKVNISFSHNIMITLNVQVLISLVTKSGLYLTFKL